MLPSMLFAVLLTGFALSNYYKYNQIIVKKLPFSQTLGDAEYELRLAKNLCKQCGGPHYLSGFLKLEEYKRTRDPELLEGARKEFSEALIRNPYSSRFYFAEGDAFNFQGKKGQAKHSYTMTGKNPRYALPALERIKTLGKIDRGLEP